MTDDAPSPRRPRPTDRLRLRRHHGPAVRELHFRRWYDATSRLPAMPAPTEAAPVTAFAGRGLSRRVPTPSAWEPNRCTAPTSPIIGAGQAGLAMSACLQARGIDHVVLERGRVAESWRSARWDSLRLLTPNWMTRLPGHRYAGPDPDGFMDRDARGRGCSRATPLPSLRRSSEAPACARSRPADGGYRVATDRGTWRARAVVVATGACEPAGGRPSPRRCPRGILQVDAGDLPARRRPARGRRAGGRRPRPAALQLAAGDPRVRAAGDAGGRPAHPDAATLSRPRHLRLARGGRDHSTKAGDGCPTSPPRGGSRRCSSPAAARSTSRGWPPQACAWSAGSRPPTARGWRSATTWRRTAPPRMHALAPGAAPDRRAYRRAGAPRRRPTRRPGAAAGASGERRAGASTSPPRASAAWSGRPAIGRDYGWLEVPVARRRRRDRPRGRRHRGARALCARPALPVPPAPRTSSTGWAATPRRWPPHVAGFLGARLAA